MIHHLKRCYGWFWLTVLFWGPRRWWTRSDGGWTWLSLHAFDWAGYHCYAEDPNAIRSIDPNDQLHGATEP